MKKAALFILFIFTLTLSFSQELDNLRVKRIALNANTLIFDSLSVIPGTFKAMLLNNNTKISELNNMISPEVDNWIKNSDSLYEINYFTPALLPTPELRKITDSLLIRYRVYHFNFSHEYYHKEPGYNQIDPLRPSFLHPAGEKKNNLELNNSSLITTGSLSRGIQIGTTQDASLNSNLNLQLHGKINQKFNIEAQLSDSNIPIQPEGNTQQIQDFDRFYIRIYDPKHEVLAGDFSLNSPAGYFIRMNKNLQGIQLKNRFNMANKPESSFTTRTTAAVTKGKYYRMKIAGSEGNQGPYRLQGQNGEQYIQIIAGSEQVWIDGELLERGEEADYVINYNTAEIRFTAKILITKDKRITVGFEYTEKSYTRFMTESSNTWTFNKGLVYFNLFSEQDAKNQPILQEISDEQKMLLTNIGDDLNKALIN
ncbi:MAG: hypothetical protein J7L96_05170, partial [Bacteroidales bacterium]|nr:hypothetical protein [Bacteroidales bacterium]